MRALAFMAFLFLCGNVFSQSVKSPSEYLSTEYGKEFTPHHLVVDYFKYAARNSSSVVFQQYGWTNEKRPLCIAIVSSPENIKNIEKIRLNNLKLTGLQAGQPDSKNAKSIVWVNFGVHGNEAGATESALSVLYRLTKKNKEWFKDVVVILNPSLNPDGFDRYVTWYRQVSNKILMPKLLSREHREDWPTGRGNHYYHDLNRDWAWGTQVETKALLKIYHEWMPHIVPDLHEQRPEKHYFFAPAVEPIHEYVSTFQRGFQQKIGANNAAAFDKNRWLFFTEEIFDMFYPGYGDSYPTFNGAIGMTYEQAGHGTAGKALLLENGKHLLIKDRIAHHVAAVLATIETGSQYNKEIIAAFKKYFDDSQNQSISAFQGYVIKKNNSSYKIQELIELLDLHQIKYRSVRYSKDAVGYDFINNKNTNFVINPGDLVLPSNQPMGVLLNVLFEPESLLVDSMTYDITAWSLPYAFGLEAYAISGALPSLSSFSVKEESQGIVGRGGIAWVVPWADMGAAKFLSNILNKGLKVRYGMEPFSMKGVSFGRGSLLISYSDNTISVDSIQNLLLKASQLYRVPVFAQNTAMTDKGPDLGSGKFRLIEQPKVAMVFGEIVDSYSYGELWHFLDEELSLPFVALSMDNLRKNKIWNFKTLIFADGDYSKLTSKTRKYIESWVKKGGNLILLGLACQTLELSSFELTPIKSENIKNTFQPYKYIERNEITNHVPGGIVNVILDNTHPLVFGYDDVFFSLKVSDMSYGLGSVGQVGWTPENIETKGFFGKQFKSHLGENLIFGVQEVGEGNVVLLIDNPLFRSFWKSGQLLISNAIFFQ